MACALIQLATVPVNRRRGEPSVVPGPHPLGHTECLAHRRGVAVVQHTELRAGLDKEGGPSRGVERGDGDVVCIGHTVIYPINTEREVPRQK